MIVYGIFDGVGQDDHLVAAALLSPEDYKEIYGRELDDHYDYLLELEDALYEIEDPVRIVRLPFHMKSYREWLASSSWEDGPEVRSAWALEVAKDPEKLGRMWKEHPILPRAPEEERDVVEVLYVPCSLVCETKEDVDRLSRQLNPHMLAELCSKIWNEMPEVPPYNKVSRLRAQGATLMLGDRFISPEDIYKAEDYFTSVLLSPPGGGIQNGVIRIPRHSRYKAATDTNTRDLPIFVITFLPVVLRDAQEDVMFLCEWLKREVDPDSPIIQDIWEMLRKAGWEGNKTELPGPFLGTGEILDFLEFLMSGFSENPPAGDDTDPGAASKASRGNNFQKRNLRRIK